VLFRSRELRNVRLHYSVNGGPTRNAEVREWRGGERYGGREHREGIVYYAEYRGVVRGTRAGDRVKVWFTGNRPGGPRRTSASFTYSVAEDTGNRVLVVANEDYEGVNPTFPPGTSAPEHAQAYVDALAAEGIRASVWDVSKQGVPHHLGVLDHFDGVAWYLGDNRLTQDPEDLVTETFFGNLPDAAVAERQQFLTIAVRDYLNEGGKLVHTGETAGYHGVLGSAIGGIYYGLDGAPEQDCVVTSDPFSDCLLLADDFFQYYLGANSRSTVQSPVSFEGFGDLAGAEGTFGGPAAEGNPLDEAGSFTITSDVLPPERFPQFASEAAGAYEGSAGGPFEPVEGAWYAGGVHVHDSYMRLTRTIDLSGVSAAQAPQLQAQLSFDTEEGYDNVIVEAHPVGSDDWTTLPEAGGLSNSDPPTECEAGFLLEEHPWLLHYLTPGNPCGTTGTSGSWHRMTGNSGGWRQVAFDLSAFAGEQVEVSISYVTDVSAGGIGVFVDDTRVVVGGDVVEAEGFETGLGPWSVPGVPAGSPPGGGDFQRAQAMLAPAVTTDDTVLYGFGVEQLGSAAERAAVLGWARRHLLGGESTRN
jgi:hypothetical protein